MLKNIVLLRLMEGLMNGQFSTAAPTRTTSNSNKQLKLQEEYLNREKGFHLGKK